MSRAGLAGRWRGAVALGAVVAMGSVAAPAWGAPVVTTTCASLSSTLSGATSGETIDLTELCHGGSLTTPTASNVTIEGAAAGDGFDGTGASGPALHGTAPAGLALRNLTFENYSLTNDSAVSLQLANGALPTIDHDAFVNNANTTSGGTPAGGGLNIFSISTCQYTGSLTISNSLFSDNVLTMSGSSAQGITGGGASVAFSCASPGTANLVITGNTFMQNSIHTTSVAANGGGLYLANDGTGQLTAMQSGNLFKSNSITQTGTAADSFSGGGEWLGSVNLTSTSDAYIGNSLPGPGASSSSEGAGLGVVRDSCGNPGPTITTSATATNLVAAGNSIGAPSSNGSVEGAGVYAGCTATTGSQGFHLTLVNSTVSGNSGPGGAAGVDGESADTLTLANSIVAGNTGAGASDIGGFGATDGANVTAADSDVCAIGSTTLPFAGAGNICADPKLASTSTGDVHETAASPTIDAGSNALVTAGVTSDYYAQPRIVGTKQASGIVDIGAAEYQTAYVAPTTPSTPTIPTPSNPNPTPPPTAQVVHEKVTSSGVDVTIHCAGTASQRCTGSVRVTTRHRRVTVTVAKKSYGLAGGQTVTLHLKLNRAGRHLLALFNNLPVKVTVTQTGHKRPISTRKQVIKLHKKRHRKP